MPMVQEQVNLPIIEASASLITIYHLDTKITKRIIFNKLFTDIFKFKVAISFLLEDFKAHLTPKERSEIGFYGFA